MFCGMPGAIGSARSSPPTCVPTDEDLVEDAVVRAREERDPVAAGDGAREANRRHDGLRARVAERRRAPSR